MRRPSVVLLALAALVAACSTPSSPTPSMPEATAAPSESPNADGVLDGFLAYGAGADHQIHLLDLATGESRQITELTDEDARLTSVPPIRLAITCGFGVSGLAWSPRGTSLAFSYGGCDSVVHVVDLDGVVTRIGDGRGPTWAPDGDLLVFSPNTPFCMGVGECGRPPHLGAWNLQVADIDAGAPPVPMMVDEATSEAGQPTWSPDGTLIAFSGRIPDRATNPDLFSATWVAGADGSDPRHLVNGAWPLGWLPDGRLLITEEQTGVVHAMDLETGDARAIGGGLSGPLEVSPDGTLYVTSVTDAAGVMGVQLATIDGQVIVERAGTIGAWAPDSGAVAILDLEQAGGIVILDRDGNELRTYALPEPFNIYPIAWQPAPES